jgi:hypothetical protein
VNWLPHIPGTHQALSLVLVEAESGLVEWHAPRDVLETRQRLAAPDPAATTGDHRSTPITMPLWSPRSTGSIHTPGCWPKRPILIEKAGGQQ